MTVTELQNDDEISDVPENPGKDIKIQSVGRYFKKNHIEHFGSIGLNVEFISNGRPSNPQELDGEVKIFENWTKEFCYERTYKIRWIKPGILLLLNIQRCWSWSDSDRSISVDFGRGIPEFSVLL